MGKIRCVVMRGGTSRGLFFHEKDIPCDKDTFNEAILRALGTPDTKQVDGLGGGTSSTSKIAVVRKSLRPDCDVDYTFYQAGVDELIVETDGNCGNISAAVGPFAIDEGLVSSKNDFTEVDIFNTNTGKKIRSRCKTIDGKFDSAGDYQIPGLFQTGSEIIMDYFEPGGAVTGKLFPTGNVTDKLEAHGMEFTITIIDCTNPYVFVSSQELKLKGTELPSEIDGSSVLAILETIRQRAAEKISLSGASFPKIAFVAQAQDYHTVGGKLIKSNEVDLVARTISLGKTHKTIPLTCAFSLAAATIVSTTVPSRMKKTPLAEGAGKKIKIGHPEGVIRIMVEPKENGAGVVRVTASRTARRIMEGFIYV